VGTWQGTPFDLNPPDNLWSGKLVIEPGGHYTLTVTHNESGLLTAKDGNWSAAPSGTPIINGMPMPTMYGGIFTNGQYSFSGSGTLNIATGSGTMTFKRGW
jgi:hypothetical protein